jgi:hypothetical protein
MFNSNLIMAVKVDGKILREFNGTVALPFGSEYSILLKNTSNRRAAVELTIDGQDVLDGTTILIPAKDSVELKRFIKNGNFQNGNAFKFIEKTERIEKFRGNKAEDGLLTVTYTFEREYKPDPNIIYRSLADTSWQGGSARSALRGSNISAQLCSKSSYSNTSSFNDGLGLAAGPVASAAAAVDLDHAPRGVVASSAVVPKNDAGITAPGSVVEQEFRPVYGFVSDGNELTMTLQMVGAIEGQPLAKPVTVKRQVRCGVCGTSCKQTAKFCHECSASIVIV